MPAENRRKDAEYQDVSVEIGRSVVRNYFIFWKNRFAASVLFLSLSLFLGGCGRRSQLIVDPGLIWGETSRGVQMSIQVDHTIWQDNDPVVTDIWIKNVSEDEVTFEGLFIFKLLDESGLAQYEAPLDFISASYGIDSRSSTTISIPRGSQYQKQIELTGLGWVLPIQSSPPDTPFNELVQKGCYRLRLDVEIIQENEANDRLYSNEVDVEMK